MTTSEELRVERRHIREIVAYLDSDDYHPAMTDAIAALAAALSATPAEDGETGTPDGCLHFDEVQTGQLLDHLSTLAGWDVDGDGSPEGVVLDTLAQLARPVPAAAPAEGPGEDCDHCGYPLIDGDHFHVMEPYEGCDGGDSGWQVTDSESEIVAVVASEEAAVALVERLNRAAAAPAVPGDEDERRLVERLRLAAERLTVASAAYDRLADPPDLDALAEWLTAIGVLRLRVDQFLAARPVPAVPQENK